MANIKNLDRIHEIAESLPKLEGARKLLSQTGKSVSVAVIDKQLTDGNKIIILPRDVNYNVLNIVNLEINKLKEELKGL